MKVETEIKQWGNSLALRVSGVMAEIPQFTVGTRVEVEVTEEGLIVKPVRDQVGERTLPYSEKALLEDLTPDSAHADELAELSTKELDY